MIEDNQHAVRVDAWLRDAPADIALDALLGRFELTFGAVWRRAHRTLGEVTLTAVLDRVLCLATEKYPLVAELEVEPNGLRCRKLLGRETELARDEVVTAVCFVMVQFLTLLGNLTAEILTSALHAELASATERLEDCAVEDRPTSRKTTDDEEMKS